MQSKYRITLFILFLISFTLAIALFCLKGLDTKISAATNVTNTQAILVLGHSSSNGKLSQRQLRRADAAKKLFKANNIAYIVPAGGFGFFNKNSSDVALAEQVKSYLVSRGVDEGSILPEVQSYDTITDLEYGLRLINQQGIKNVAVVTSYPHVIRSKYVFNKFFAKEYPNTYVQFVVSDYYVGVFDTLWDLGWEIGGWSKTILLHGF